MTLTCDWHEDREAVGSCVAGAFCGECFEDHWPNCAECRALLVEDLNAMDSEEWN